MKRVLLSMIVLLSACTFVADTTRPAQAQSTMEIARGNCKAASDKCQQTLTYVTNKKGKLAAENVTDALKDCIQVCNAAEKILARNSQLGGKTSSLTIQACTEVAKACDQFPGDAQMQGCANEVRKCIGNLQKLDKKTGG